jgi:hypothetical protein
MLNSESWTGPTPSVRAELIEILRNDSGLHGEIWRSTEAGLSDEEIQKARGANYPNFIWNYRRYTRALLEGDLPKGATLLNETAVLFRRINRLAHLTNDCKRYLEGGLHEIALKVGNRETQAQEEQSVLTQTITLEKKSSPGIYVYSLMHYLRFPYDQGTGRTLMKVGRSDRDVIKRFREQIRTTALPEEPVLLRIYENSSETTGLADLEKRFHSLLEAADHDRSAARTGGTEWFLTSLKFLDEIGSTLNLKIILNTDINTEVN